MIILSSEIKNFNKMKAKLKLEKIEISKLNRNQLISIGGGTGGNDDPKSEYLGPLCDDGAKPPTTNGGTEDQ